MVTFRVDDVVPATEMLPTQPLGDLFPEALVMGGDLSSPVLVPSGVHPLLDAVARAFADHRPLVLSPDAVWLTIAQGVAQHVRLHAGELRPQLVNHTGRQRLAIELGGPVPQTADSWRHLVGMFQKLLTAEVSGAEIFECDFSTSTEVEQVAARVVLLDVYSPYFSLWIKCICGIPSITLTGTVEDWEKIRSRVAAIAKFGLEKWCKSLVPIADHFVWAAQGNVDTAFWRRIYNPADAYGGPNITGWIARLFPYLNYEGANSEPNPLLGLRIGEPRDLTTDGGPYRGPGVRSDTVPATLSRVIVNVSSQAGQENFALALHAGLVGVAQEANGALKPVAGWYLTRATVEIEDVIERIRREHEASLPVPVRLMYASAELVALYRGLSSAALFDGAWQLLAVREHCRVQRGSGARSLLTIIDLADGRSVAAATDSFTETMHWVVCQVEEVPGGGLIRESRLVDDPAEVPVYGTSLAMLLEAAMDSGGDISHLQTGWLKDLDERAR